MGSMFGGLFGCVISLVMIALVIYPMWRIFEKVGYPGVASLIMLVPIVNLIALWYGALDMSAEAVAEKVLGALEVTNPAARYPAGRGARAIVTARKILPDRAMDVLIRQAFKG